MNSVPGSFSKNMQAAELARKGITVVSVEGGIGVGKSTVMTHLQSASRPFYIDEPVDLWEKAGLLDAMYRGTIPPGTFQIAALSTRMALAQGRARGAPDHCDGALSVVGL